MTDLIGDLMRRRASASPPQDAAASDSATDAGAQSGRSLLEPPHASLRTLFTAEMLAREDRWQLARKIDNQGGTE